MTTTRNAMIVTAVIAKRELVRFTRQPSRVLSAIGTAGLLWLFLAGGFAEAIRPEAVRESSYSLFLLPGMITLTAVFASIFSSIALIEDRAGGWLQAVLVSPAPRWTIALGRASGGAAAAAAQALLLFFALPVVGARVDPSGLALGCLAVLITCLGVTSLGLAFAWRCESTAGFHGVMNMVLMPMWLLSGAFFPADTSGSWLRHLVNINPLTWCTRAIRGALTGNISIDIFALPALFAAAALGMAMFAMMIPGKRAGSV